MTGRELIINLLNNKDINLDNEVALATRDGAFDSTYCDIFARIDLTKEEN